MKLSILFIIIIFLSLNGFSRNEDSLLYNSEFEKTTFEAFDKDSAIDPLRFFCSIDYSDGSYKEMSSKIDEMVNEMKSSGIERKSLKKKIRIIYEKVHSTLFKKYQENIAFNEILKSGTYNCVTATAVYASVLNRFNIEYDIMEKPNHVYIIVTQDEANIIMESTNPSSGIVSYDEKFKKTYVKYLNDVKIISEDEYVNNSINELFKANFYNDDTINITQLAGLHYYNKGLKLIEKELFEKSSSTLNKAYILYKTNTKILYTYNVSLSLYLDEQSSTENYQASTIAKLLRLNYDNENMKSKIESSFSYILSNNNLNKSNIEKSKSFYYEFLNYFTEDTLDIENFKFTFHLTSSYYYHVDGKYDISMEYADSAYTINPLNMKAKGLIHDNFAKTLYKFSQTEDEEQIDIILDDFRKYPFMMEYPQFKDVYFVMLFVKSGLAYEENEVDLGHQLLMDCETEYRRMGTPIIIPEAYESTFEELSHYYSTHKGLDSLDQIFARWHKLMPDYKFLITEPKNVRKRKHNTVNYVPTYNTEKVVTDEKKAKLYKAEEYKKLFKKTFTGSWESKEYRLAGTKNIIKGKTVKLVSKKGGYFNYIVKGKIIRGKWSIRPKSKLLYLIPDSKDKYYMFRIIKLTEDKIELKYYEDRKISNEILIFYKCK